VGVESRTTVEMARTIVLPAANRYQGELAATCASLKAVGTSFDSDTLDRVSGLVTQLQSGIRALEEVMAAHAGDTTLAHAEHCCNVVQPAMLAVRVTADALESVVADDLWPLATYQEMLFIK
jgi:glutamine synthetase